jgi:hydrogenase maturation protease
MTPSHASPVVVLGIGNVFASDDGFGPSVLSRLEETVRLPHTVEAIDLGTAGLDMVDYIVERRAAILVDTIQRSGPAGTLCRLDRPQLLAGVAGGPRFSPHQPAIGDVLQIADLAGGLPGTVILLGVIPANLEVGTGLTAPVAAAVDPTVDAVAAELHHLGETVEQRIAVPTRQARWWETEALEPERMDVRARELPTRFDVSICVN